jgi:hypothetical protein
MRLARNLAIGIAILGTTSCRDHGESAPDVNVLDSVVAASGARIFPAPDRVMNGPTVIAFYALTKEQVARGGDASEAFADFERQLKGVDRALDSLGVRLDYQYSDTIQYQVNGVAHAWHPPSDSLRVGYLFLGPGRILDVQYGVMTNSDLLDQTRNWLRKAPSGPR